MIIGQSIYNVPVLTYLLEMKIFSIVEYQLKCCSVADNAVHGLVWSSMLSTRPSTSGVDGCAPVWELMDNTSNICSETQTSLFDWFHCFMTLLELCVLKPLLALQGTVAACQARFGGLSDVNVLLQNSSRMYLLKFIKFDGTSQTCCTQ